MKRWRQAGFLAAVIALAIYGQRARTSAIAALAAGITLGLVVVLAWSVLSPQLSRRQIEEVSGDRTRRCHRCGVPIRRFDLICSQCGAIVREGLFLGYAATVVLVFAGIVLWRTGVLNVWTAGVAIVTTVVAGLALTLGQSSVTSRSQK